MRLHRSPHIPAPGGDGYRSLEDQVLSRAALGTQSADRPRDPQFKRVSPPPAHGAMAHVGSRKRSRSRSRSRGRGSEKKRKKSSKDAPRSCSASRSQSRKASTTSSGAEGENQREWERGEGTSWRKLQAAGRAFPDWLWENCREHYSKEDPECRSWVSGLKDAQNPAAGPAH